MITKKIAMFQNLEIETCSMCNRFCNTCLRNSIPNRESVSSWFEDNLLPTDDYQRILDQARNLGFKGQLCLSHYNEPMMDERLVDLVTRAKTAGFPYVFFGSNGDFLTEQLAFDLDGLIDYIGFSFYMEEPKKSERMAWVKTLFKKSKITLGHGDHMVTHFSPLANVIQLGRRNKDKPCMLPKKRMIINHRGDMLLCCDDLVGNFNLGNIKDYSLEELWYSDRHQNFVQQLEKSGGRKVHPHCLSCPRS